MTNPLRLILSAVILLAAALVGCLQTEPRTVTPDESKIQIGHVPGLGDRPIVYRYYGWRPSYQAVEQYYAGGMPTAEEYSAEIRSSGSAYPRMEVRFYVAAPGWTWDRELDVNQEYVKGFSFFQDKPVSIALRRPMANPGVEVVAFQAAGANCFAFVARDLTLPRPAGEKTLPVSADGYYCAAPGVKIDAALTSAVLSNVMVTDSLARPRTPILPLAAAQVPSR